MPRAKRITPKIVKSILKDIIEGSDKDAAMKAIKLDMDIQKELDSNKQTQRSKVIERKVNREKLYNLIKWSPYYNYQKGRVQKHPEQIKALESNANEIVINAGRQGGKTICAALIALEALLEENQSICLIAPTYTLTGRVMDYLRIWIAKYFKGEMRVVNRPFPTITTKWGSYLDGKSAEQPDQILGKGYDLIIVDECARVSEDVYLKYIMAASGIKIGKYVFISTPTGRTWFWRKWREADKVGGAFHWESKDSPYFSKEKWEQEKKRMPEFIFRQEYKAEFLENATVFQGIDNCIKKYEFPQEYNPKHLYIVGIDLARYQDFTVVTVMDRMTNQLVNVHRFQGGWALQKEKIVSVLDKYGNAPVWIDATSITVGDAYVEELENAGYSVTGYKISSNLSKRELVEKLVVAIQNGYIQLPDIKSGTPESEELITEMRAFTYNMSPSGMIRYEAPQGEHDDAVMALALSTFDLDDKTLNEIKEGGEILIQPIQTF